MKIIKRALISVADKNGLLELATQLKKYDIEIIASDGTADFLIKNNIPAIKVSDYTKFPEILGGRVKTLNPLIFGGILAKREDEEHLLQLKSVNAKLIDLVIIDLYHFNENPSVEKIDIGGSALLRATAKNFHDTAIIIENSDYQNLINELETNNGKTSLNFRRGLAEKAFRFNSYYDNCVANWLASQNHKDYLLNIDNNLGTQMIDLRYGENPGQSAIFHSLYSKDKINFKQLGGKELSYNNLMDADAAIHLAYEFTEPAIVIVKHNNPCCVAMGANLNEAYLKAIKADSESSFGGIVACNSELDGDTAIEIIKIFTELVIAPSFSDEALLVLKTKANLRVLTFDDIKDISNNLELKTILGGLLIQKKDYDLNEANWKCVTDTCPDIKEMNDAKFAYLVSKHVKSNAIIFAYDGAAVAIGPGQTSRVQSARIAESRLKANETDYEHKKLIMASDGFLPFADSLQIAIDNNIKIVIQPGGSIRDQEVIAKANEFKIAMIFTGQRVFKH